MEKAPSPEKQLAPRQEYAGAPRFNLLGMASGGGEPPSIMERAECFTGASPSDPKTLMNNGNARNNLRHFIPLA